MIKEALLGLLAGQERHGYDLKLALDEIVGRTRPINVGQVYTALNKLEKDGLVAARLLAREEKADMKVYSLTAAGEAELRQWLSQPVEAVDLRNELFLKLSLARRLPQIPGGAAAVIRAQRTAHLQAIQELTQLKAQLEAKSEVGLLIDGALLHLEADLNWLDLWEKQI